jgi:hypothetical protein
MRTVNAVAHCEAVAQAPHASCMRYYNSKSKTALDHQRALDAKPQPPQPFCRSSYLLASYIRALNGEWANGIPPGNSGSSDY